MAGAEGGSWAPLPGPLAGAITSLAVDPVHPQVVYAGTALAGAFKSVDGGRHWLASNHGLIGAVVTFVAVDPHDESVWARGRSWSALSGLRGPVARLAVDFADPSTLYAVSSGTLLRSVNQGASWRPEAAGLAGALPFDLAASPAAPGSLYLSTGDGQVFRSTDRARHWQRRSAGPVRGSALFLAADPVRPGVLFAFGGHAFFRSVDGGATWSFLGAGLGQVHLSGALAIDPRQPEVLYAGTSDLGLWRLSP